MRCNKAKTLMVFAGCAVWLAVLGWVDRATGYELGLFAFYTAPVGVVAWNLGRGPGIIAAFIASVIWYMADRYAGDRYTAPSTVTGTPLCTSLRSSSTRSPLRK